MKNEVRPIDAEPLTLEQLRGMDGQPVMVKYLESEDGGINTGVILMNDPNESDNGVYVGCTFFCIKEYEKNWLVYAYPPAHIDRETWTAEWEEDGECDHKPYRVRDAEKWKKYKCSKCGYKAGRRTSQKYCPSCGRAMTPEAWAELEKRMGLA